MRRSSYLFFVIASFFAGNSGIFAQSHQVAPLTSCIKEFYDPGMYNYLSFRNNCSHGVSIVFIAKDESGASGTMDLRAGASDSVGLLRGGVVPKIGHFQLYVCQLGYVPVDEFNKTVTKPKTIYTCQPKVQ